ncbi:MAG: hypothetical protein BWY69_01656 [Planctomycetes bacterium ADurb.Bin401]|nr:MAG: hypothetical protein BWY69_01656 [Planctomycetes bacterium ADurb.Bin401]
MSLTFLAEICGAMIKISVDFKSSNELIRFAKGVFLKKLSQGSYIQIFALTGGMMFRRSTFNFCLIESAISSFALSVILNSYSEGEFISGAAKRIVTGL